MVELASKLRLIGIARARASVLGARPKVLAALPSDKAAAGGAIAGLLANAAAHMAHTGCQRSAARAMVMLGVLEQTSEAWSQPTVGAQAFGARKA